MKLAPDDATFAGRTLMREAREYACLRGVGELFPQARLGEGSIMAFWVCHLKSLVCVRRMGYHSSLR